MYSARHAPLQYRRCFKSYVHYSPSGRNALCIVRDAHHYSAAVVVESYVPYSPSGRNALFIVRDAHRYSAVVIESYAPYSRSGRNALCVVPDAHRCSAVVELTQLTFFFQAGNPPQIDADCCSKLRGRSTKTPEGRAALGKRDSTPIKDVLETNSSRPQKVARWWVSSRPSRQDAVSSDVES